MQNPVSTVCCEIVGILQTVTSLPNKDFLQGGKEEEFLRRKELSVMRMELLLCSFISEFCLEIVTLNYQ